MERDKLNNYPKNTLRNLLIQLIFPGKNSIQLMSHLTP
jgi:hypothetical protein